jgi:hypothetical protein
MALPEETLREISQITSDLIEIGLSIDQNFPVLRSRAGGVRELGFGSAEALSRTLRNVAVYTGGLLTSSHRHSDAKGLVSQASESTK